MFNKSDIQKVTGMDIVISADMIKKIEEWVKMYKGKAPWCDDYIKSLKLEQGICREFSDVVLSEMTISVSNKKLDDIIQKSTSSLSENLQAGLAYGSFILKPLGADKYEFVTADKFVPISFDDAGDITACVFVSRKKVKDDSFYTRFELHELTKEGLHIHNWAYHSNNETDIGRPCELSEVYEWSGLLEDVIYPSVKQIDFGYYRNPIKNEIDDTFAGVSIYESATELIRKADIQFGRLDWEYESGERVLHVDITALQATPQIGVDGKTHYQTPKLNKRLYRGLNLTGKGEDLYKEWSPEFRDENLIRGLEQIKRNIEFNVGLAYGDLSDVQSVEKTATEIKHAKQRKYNRVNAIERNLSKCLEGFCWGLAFYNGLTTSGYEVTINFNDSILTDEEAERKEDRQDLANGTLRPEEYRAKWRGETIEEALKNLPQTSQVIE